MRAFKVAGVTILAATLFWRDFLTGCQSGGDTIKIGILAPFRARCPLSGS